jgi:predicted DsbA family dithiol-disulfide isomerase
MHDALYEHPDARMTRILSDTAFDLGLNVQQFERDLCDGRYEERIRDDCESGLESGVPGTPTFSYKR